MRSRFSIGAKVALKHPLPQESCGPWRVTGMKLHVVPVQYELVRDRKAMKPATLKADENELEPFDRALHESIHTPGAKP